MELTAQHCAIPCSTVAEATGGCGGVKSVIWITRLQVPPRRTVEPALALGDELGVGALEIERRLEWEAEGDAALRATKLGSVERWVAVGFETETGQSWVGIDAAGDCYVSEAGVRRPCGIGRQVVSPARIQLREVNGKVRVTIDNTDNLPESLNAPTGAARLLVLCQNQFCRFDPKRR